MRQKAAKRAAQELQQQPDAQQQSKANGQTTASRTAQQRTSGTDRNDPMAAADEKAAAESAAYMIAAACQHPANARVQRVARLRDKQWQITVLHGTKAAGMNELKLGEALTAARNEQQRKEMMQTLMQQVNGLPGAVAASSGAPLFGRQPAMAGSTPMETHDDFALYS